MNIIEFYSKLQKEKSHWVKRSDNKEAIVRVFPKPDINNTEDNAKFLILTKFPFRKNQIKKLLNDQNRKWANTLIEFKIKYPNFIMKIL